MEWLRIKIANNEVSLWISAILLVVAFLIAYQLVRMVLRRQLVQKRLTNIDGWVAILTSVTSQTRPFFVWVISIYISSSILALPAVVSGFLHVVFITTVLVQIGLWASSLITSWSDHHIRRQLEQDNTTAISMAGVALLMRILVWLVLVLLILENMTGIQVTTLVASLGITGVAVALAVQSILSDLFASLSITLDRPFGIGDFILVGDFVGTVEHVGLKSTRVRSLTGEQLVFSNSDLLNSRIRNFKRMERRRISFTLGVTYQTSPEHIEQIPQVITEIITAQPGVTFDRSHFQGFGDSSLLFETVYFVENPDYRFYMDTQQTINLTILKQFNQMGVQFAYPTQTLFIEGQSTGPSGLS